MIRGCCLAVACAACGGHAAPAAAPVQSSVPDLAGACAALHPNDIEPPPIAELPRAPLGLVGTTTDGAAFDLANLRGHAVLVAFEAPWAMVSQKDDATLPVLARAMGKDLEIVRVASAEDVAGARERAGAYPNVFDKPPANCAIGPLTHSWGVDALPETFLVDRAGNIRMHFVNWRDWSSPEAAACMRALAADPMRPIAAPPARAVAAIPQKCASMAAADTGGVRGTIRIGSNVHAKPGTAIFVIARRGLQGPPVAAAKLVYNGADLPFVLDQNDVMLEGTSLAGEITVTARYDRDGDAVTRQPGDFTGQVNVTSPAADVMIVIDTPVR